MAPKQRINKTLRENVWRKHFGNKGEGVCVICKRVVTVWEFDVCHRQSRKNCGTLELDNLEIGCHECNIRQGSMNLEDYMKNRGVPSNPQLSTNMDEYSNAWKTLEIAEKKHAIDLAAGDGGNMIKYGELNIMSSKLKSVRMALADLSSQRRRLCDLGIIEGLELERIAGFKNGEHHKQHLLAGFKNGEHHKQHLLAGFEIGEHHKRPLRW